MKRIIINSIIAFAVTLAAQQITEAQGTLTYLSNLGLGSAGAVSVGNDAWFAANFITGTNAGGYMLDSVQLKMLTASGNPSGFTVMLYSATGIRYLSTGEIYSASPENSLDTLSGSLNPVTSGIYTYTPVSSLFLTPNTPYFVTVAAEMSVADGAYFWGITFRPPLRTDNSDRWGALFVSYHSSDGANWNSYASGDNLEQFAVNATAIPEPSSLCLLLLGSGFFIYVRRAFHR